MCQRPDQDDLPHTEWKCEECGAVNSCLDGDCQFCDGPSKDKTLDTAAEIFKASPDQETAKAYCDAALDYWFDDMIGDETLLTHLHQIREG